MAQLAVEFQIDRRTVKKRLANVDPSGTSKNGYPAYKLADVAGPLLGIKLIQSGDCNPEELTPKERKDWYDGEHKRRDLQIRDRELIPVEEFTRIYSHMLKVVAAGLETLPDMLERDAGLSGKQLEPVFTVVDGLRETIYHELGKL